MKLAITQIVMGVLILVDCLSFRFLASPALLFVIPALGLVVLGCGIAQFLKARSLRGASPLLYNYFPFPLARGRG